MISGVNPDPSYLAELTIRLGTGMGRLPAATRDRHAAYLKSAQRPDGGFAGRLGGSDLYYTSFALRALAIMGELQGEVAERSLAFLRSRLAGHESLIDLMSLVFAAALLEMAAGLDVFAETADTWREALAVKLGDLRCDDGGYAKGPGGVAGSTYHTFLVLLCRELIGQPIGEDPRILEFLRAQRADEGGFREIRVGKRAGTNPTAAAIGILRMLNALDAEIRTSTAEFLSGMQNEEGGLLANSRIPIADILSTFTGILTLDDLGTPQAIDRRAALRFVQSLEQPDGGFWAAAWDEARDVEYTFYGLGCLALLSADEG